MKRTLNQLNPDTQICSDHLLYFLSHRNPCTLQRLDLLLCSPAAPADNGTGMAHDLTGRRAYSLPNHGQSNHYVIPFRKCNLELYATATEVTECTEGELEDTEKASLWPLCSLWQKVTKNRYCLVYFSHFTIISFASSCV